MSLCCETLPQAAGWLSAPETLHHPACSGARRACSAVTSRSRCSFAVVAEKRQRLCAFIVVSGGIRLVRLDKPTKTQLNYKSNTYKHLVASTLTFKLFLFLFQCVFFFFLFAVTCVCSVSALVLRRASVPVQPVRCLFHPEGQPAASHQAPFGGEALQVSPVQLRLSQEGRPHRPSTHPLG